MPSRQRWIVPTAAALLLVPIPAASQIRGPDRIQNGDFETCDLLPGWAARGNITFDGSVTNARAHTGSCSLELLNLDIIQQRFGPQGVTTQGVLTFWVLAPPLSTGACLPFAAFYEYVGGTRTEMPLTCTTEWTEVSAQLDRSLRVSAVGFSTVPGEPTVYIDDVSMPGLPPEVDEPPPLEDDSDGRGRGLGADLCHFLFRGNETLCVLGLIVATLAGFGVLWYVWRRRRSHS